MTRKKIVKKTTAAEKRSAAKQKKAVRKMVGKRTQVKANLEKARGVPRRRTPVDLNVEVTASASANFIKKAGPSMYKPVLDKVKDLKPGEMVKVEIPRGTDPVKFRQKISAAVRKRLTDEDRPVGNLRTRLIENDKRVITHVAVVCRAPA